MLNSLDGREEQWHDDHMHRHTDRYRLIAGLFDAQAENFPQFVHKSRLAGESWEHISRAIYSKVGEKVTGVTLAVWFDTDNTT